MSMKRIKRHRDTPPTSGGGHRRSGTPLFSRNSLKHGRRTSSAVISTSSSQSSALFRSKDEVNVDHRSVSVGAVGYFRDDSMESVEKKRELKPRKVGLWKLRESLAADVSIVGSDEENILNELENFNFEQYKDGSFTLFFKYDGDKTTYPYWLGYGSATADWMATLMSVQMPNISLVNREQPCANVIDTSIEMTKSKSKSTQDSQIPRVPKKVLDIGCGPYLSWVIECAFLPGWENTSFVGMDVVPCLYPINLLIQSIGDRVAFLAGNLLEKWPWNSEEFDLIHLGNLGRAVPECQWHHIMEEASRCLAPDGVIEIWDYNFQHPPCPTDATDALLNPNNSMTDSDVLRRTEKTSISLDRILLLNSCPLSLIPPLLPLYISSKVKTTGVHSVPPTDCTAGPIVVYDDAFPELTDLDRATENARTVASVKAKLNCGMARILRSELKISKKKLDQRLEEYSHSTAIDNALSSLIEKKFDWACEFDYLILERLEAKIPFLEKVLTQDMKIEDLEDPVVKAMGQKMLEETRAELLKTKRRLKRDPVQKMMPEVELAGWIARKGE